MSKDQKIWAHVTTSSPISEKNTSDKNKFCKLYSDIEKKCITETKFQYFSMHVIFLGRIPGFPGGWEPRYMWFLDDDPILKHHLVNICVCWERFNKECQDHIIRSHDSHQ